MRVGAQLRQEVAALRQGVAALWMVMLVATTVACGGGAPATAPPAGPTGPVATATTGGGRATVTAIAGTAATRATAGTASPARPGAASPSAAVRTTPTRSPAASPSPRAGATPRVSSYPLAVRDDAGRSVTLARKPQKIVSLAPSNTEILYALGLGDRVVGVDQFSDYPVAAGAKPKVGSFARINVEAVVGLAPDLVLATGIHAGGAVPALEGQGLVVVVLNPSDSAGVLENIGLVGQLADANAAAAGLRGDLEARIAVVSDRLRGTTARPRVFYEIDPTGFTAGPSSVQGDLIARAGGVNVAAGAQSPYPQLSAEAIIAGDPEVIVLSDEGQGGVTVESVGARPGWSNISAVKNGRVVGLDQDAQNLFNRPGPRVVDALELLARLLHPELFR